jgi:hypothetical protein
MESLAVAYRRSGRTWTLASTAGIVFLKVDNVRNGPIMAAIESVEKGRFGKRDLNFSDGTCLGLNKTNTRVLANAYGTDSDDLINKQIKLKLGTIFYQSTPREVDKPT